MAENRSARTRLLTIVDILKVYSNESNVLSIEEICTHLEKYGYEATKRNVVADIKSINTTPYKIIYVTKPKKGYYLVRDFTLSAAESLMTAVYSSERLSESDRKNARNALQRILSLPTNELLLSTTERVSPDIPHESLSWENIMSLRAAVFRKKKVRITVSLTEIGDSFDSVEDEEFLTVTPVKIAISPNSTLFVFTNGDSSQAFCIHLCRIRKVEILNDDAEDFTGNIDDAIGYFSGTVIKNRHKTAKWVFLRLKTEDAELVRNYFDAPVKLRKDDVEGYCIAKVFTVLDERFIGWLLCYGDKIEIIAPNGLRDYFAGLIKNNILTEEV